MSSQTHILAMNPATLAEHPAFAGEPRFRVGQFIDWVFVKGILDLNAMGNIPGKLRGKLEEHFTFGLPEITDRLDSADGSSKLLLKTSRGNIEAVILRYPGRVSLCVSSQVGCKLACRFCQTGKLGFMRHLGAEEILAQFVLAKQIVAKEGRRLSHVVFMGMGEPLDNFDAVIHAVRLMISPDAYGLSGRNVTVSTSGLVPQIERIADEVHSALAISLHAANDELRTRLMPINRKYPLAKLKQAMLQWQKTTGRKITIEYILIRDENCDVSHAKELVRFLHGLRAKINLIPFNAHPGLDYQRPTDEAIRDFQSYLTARSFAAPVRYSKGLDVSAACGQLAAKVASNLASAPNRKQLVENASPQM